LKFGVLGGTFDPVHLGHLRMGEEVCERLDLDKVFLIPGSLPPHKINQILTPFNDRLKMVQMAVEPSSMLDALDLEGKRKGLSYSIETLRELHDIYGSNLELFFIIGMDAFSDINTWKEYKELFKAANFVVINRPGISFGEIRPFVDSLDVGFEKENTKSSFISPSGNRLSFIETTLLEISSTKIRELVASGKSIRYLVPEPVRLYIMEKRLYFLNEDTR
jgi:nicotinate-nucleotide adenylyltransferase